MADVPPPASDWGEMMRFARTFDGYEYCGSFEAAAAIANARANTTLSELRTCLFFEQRRWNHTGGEPDDASIAYCRRVVDEIRAKVEVGSIE